MRLAISCWRRLFGIYCLFESDNMELRHDVTRTYLVSEFEVFF